MKQYPNLELFFYEAAIPVVVQHASPSEANDYFESYIQVHQRDDLSIRDKYQKAIIDIRNDSISKAINQIESLKHQPVEGWDSMLAVSAQYLLAQKLKDYRDQATLGDSLLKINVRYYMESMNQRALPIQRDYYADKARESEFKLDTLHSRSTITLSCLILILLTGIIIYFIRINIHKLQHENEARRIVALNHEVDYYRSENTSLTKALESNISDSIKHQSSLFKEKWILLNKLCNNLADDSNPTEISQTIILRQIKATLEEINRPDNLKEIEDQVNKYNDNVILLLRSECAFLKETAISLITLYIAGFSSKSICFITGTKLKTFYTRRDRIINKIQEADFSKTELIMTLLKNRNT